MGYVDTTFLSPQAVQGDEFFVTQKFIEKPSGFNVHALGKFVAASKVDLSCSCKKHVELKRTIEQAQRHTASRTQIYKPERTRPCSNLTGSHEQEIPVLTSMNLFCGAGLLARGIEKCRYIHKAVANDHDDCAMQTNIANTRHSFRAITGSVNYLLREAAAWLRLYDCAFGLLVAGSPCVGFSRANRHRDKVPAARNCSLATSSLSFIDMFVPPYVLLENVKGMDEGDANVCQQIIACLVALGYSVDKWLLNSYDHGDPQDRDRLFILAAAPILHLPECPKAIPAQDKQTFGCATKKLARVHNDKTVNTVDPDHIPVKRLPPEKLAIVKCIPKSSPGANLYRAYKQNRLSGAQNTWYLEQTEERRDSNSNSYRRLDKDRPFPTILTSADPSDARLGRVLHPSEDRLRTLTETKKAFSCEEDVIIGPLTRQIRQLGNGVPMKLAAALGNAIGEAHKKWCEASPPEVIQYLFGKEDAELTAEDGGEVVSKGDEEELDAMAAAQLDQELSGINRKDWSLENDGFELISAKATPARTFKLPSRSLTPVEPTRRSPFPDEDGSRQKRRRSPCAEETVASHKRKTSPVVIETTTTGTKTKKRKTTVTRSQ